MVINSRITPEEDRPTYDEVYTDEWKNGAYFVMSSSGMKGWIGEGWVMPITI
jgi:hypothetical protein